MLASFIASALLSGAQLARSSAIHLRDTGLGTGIALSLYTDHACSTPSASNPNITLGLNVCAVTTGLESFILSPVPCTSGDVAHWVFTDVACGDVSDAYYRGASNNMDCYAAYDGAMAAVMLTCDGDADETEPSRPTSTTTIAVGPVATAGASTAAPAVPSTSSGTTGNGGGKGASTTNSAASGWNSLDLGARIGIIVALAVGSILIGSYTAHIKKKKRIERGNSMSLRTYPPNTQSTITQSHLHIHQEIVHTESARFPPTVMASNFA